MARAWQALRLLLATLVALVALTNQGRKKTFLKVEEVSIREPYVEDTIQFMISKFNQENKDLYNFRVIRILNIKQQITDHKEYHIEVEMRRTTCQKLETTNCKFQEGELYKQIKCFFSVFVIPWFEKYKILSRNCTDA
ncbi:cystatin-11 [Trichechus manatus latirostris]|uniref:Cystatin-11 n=1 Tax=Trichechus manatus latirostris TaxID=127582 RepID=A0A2Y9DKY1_TRIMA|nr:cystatin-11 [Trichechus manatus latirostris]